jgi:hypothetical protein
MVFQATLASMVPLEHPALLVLKALLETQESTVPRVTKGIQEWQDRLDQPERQAHPAPREYLEIMDNQVQLGPRVPQVLKVLADQLAQRVPLVLTEAQEKKVMGVQLVLLVVLVPKVPMVPLANLDPLDQTEKLVQ